MKKLIYGLIGIGLLGFGSSAKAAIIWSFGTEFSNETGELSGPVVVTLDDGGESGNVQVTVDSSGLDENLSEYISGLYLNINPTKEASLPLNYSDTGGDIAPSGVSQAKDAHKADGDGLYDIQIDWANTAFVAGMTSIFTFSLAELVEEDFNFLSTPDGGGHGPFYAVLRARSLGADGEDSGWFYPTGGFDPGDETPIPEPGSALLFLVGLIGLSGLVWRHAKVESFRR